MRRHETNEQGHGREEQRTYFICPVPDNLPERGRWAGFKAIGIAINQTVRGGKACSEVRGEVI